jgi:hypothetical protein
MKVDGSLCSISLYPFGQFVSNLLIRFIDDEEELKLDNATGIAF